MMLNASVSSSSIERPLSSSSSISKSGNKSSGRSLSSSFPKRSFASSTTTLTTSRASKEAEEERRTTKMEASTSEKNTNLTKLGLTALAACAAVHCADPAFASETSSSLMHLAGDAHHSMQHHNYYFYNEALSQTGMAGEDIPFWANMAKYARFSISIMVGFVYMFARPVAKLLKEPKTAVLVVVAAIGGFQFFKWTITEMLAMNDPESFM